MGRDNGASEVVAQCPCLEDYVHRMCLIECVLLRAAFGALRCGDV